MDRCLGIQAGLKLREAGWQIELHKDHFEEDAEDRVWIPEVSRKEWVILTKDKALRRKEIERTAIRISRARVFTLPQGKLNSQQMVEMFLRNGLKMGRFLKDHPGPFIANVTRNGVEELGLNLEAEEE